MKWLFSSWFNFPAVKFELEMAGCEARMLPLCNAVHPISADLKSAKGDNFHYCAKIAYSGQCAAQDLSHFAKRFASSVQLKDPLIE